MSRFRVDKEKPKAFLPAGNHIIWIAGSNFNKSCVPSRGHAGVDSKQRITVASSKMAL